MNLTYLNSAELSNILTSRKYEERPAIFQETENSHGKPIHCLKFHSTVTWTSLPQCIRWQGSLSEIRQGWALAEGTHSTHTPLFQLIRNHSTNKSNPVYFSFQIQIPSYVNTYVKMLSVLREKVKNVDCQKAWDVQVCPSTFRVSVLDPAPRHG